MSLNAVSSAEHTKCNLKVPQCSACEKQGEVCNITEYVAYPYALVESLHLRVKELEEKLAAGKDGSTYNPHTGEPSTNPPFVTSGKTASPDVSKEAEEVGVLAIGFADRYSQAKYGEFDAQLFSMYVSAWWLIETISWCCCWFNFRSNILQASWHDHFIDLGSRKCRG